MSEAKNTSRRGLIAASTLGAGALLAAALLIIVNYFGWKYHDRFDWTGSELYSLSEKTESVLANLERDVEAVVFLTPAEPELYDPTIELLSRYQAATSRFSFRTLDAEKNPAEAQSLIDRYQITGLNVVVFDTGDDRRVVESSDLAEYDYSGMQFGQGPSLEAFKGEQMFTGAILELAEDRKPKILFTTGHGELELEDAGGRGLSAAQDFLGRDNLQLESWSSLGQPAVPDGTDLVVIAGPTSGFLEPEVAVLRDYLEAGGRLLALIDPILSETGQLGGSGLESLLADYGVELGADLVVDPSNPLPFYGAETIFVNSYGTHPITRALNETQVPVLVPLARSVSAAEAADGVTTTELLLTSADGWGETDLENLGAVELGDGDLEGPVSLAVAVEVDAPDDAPEVDPATDEATEGGAASGPAVRIVVFGDSDFASNAHLASVGNSGVVANTMNWLIERETLLGIPPKSPELVRMSLTQGQLRWLNWLILGILPVLSIALGVVVYFRRRR